jgi:hypothetical protein
MYSEGGVLQSSLIREQSIVHLPELALLASALGGGRRLEGVRVYLLERHVLKGQEEQA